MKMIDNFVIYNMLTYNNNTSSSTVIDSNISNVDIKNKEIYELSNIMEQHRYQQQLLQNQQQAQQQQKEEDTIFNFEDIVISGPSAMESLQAQKDFDITSFSELLPVPIFSSYPTRYISSGSSTSSSYSDQNSNINNDKNMNDDSNKCSGSSSNNNMMENDSDEDEDDATVPVSMSDHKMIDVHFLDETQYIQQQHDYSLNKKTLISQSNHMLDHIPLDTFNTTITNYQSDSIELVQSSLSFYNLECLPVEILFSICKFLNVESLRNLSIVNKFFQEMGNQEDIWKHLFYERFGCKAKLPQSLNWKKFYCSHNVYTGDWDKGKKGKMVISREGLTVSHGGDYLGSYQSARGSIRIDSGCTYWEILIESLNFNQTGFHLVIGVIPESFTVWQSYLTSNGGWGYLADGRKANNSGNGIPYAKGFVQGDRVGVLVDMNEKTLSFYLNGVSQGVAFRNIEQPVYPGVSLLTGGQSISFIPNPAFPKLYQ